MVKMFKHIDCTNNPPEYVVEPPSPSDIEDEKIREHLLEISFEEDTTFGEIDSEYFCELIKWEKWE